MESAIDIVDVHKFREPNEASLGWLISSHQHAWPRGLPERFYASLSSSDGHLSRLMNDRHLPLRLLAVNYRH